MEISKNASGSNSNDNHYKWSSSDSRNKEENVLSDKNRIGFLNQCKLELSAEVYHWKEENFKLKRENEAAIKRIEELETTISRVSHQNKQLENNLILAQEDNKRLKMRTLAIGEQNSMLYERLAKSRFHSYPWSETANANHTNSVQDAPCVDNVSSSANESLEEVSKRLFKQMQKEILEMQKFEHSLGIQEIPHVQNKTPPEEDTLKSKPCNNLEELAPQTEETARKIKSLLHEINTLKHHVKFQNEKLHFLLNQIAKDNENKSNASVCDKKNTALNSLKHSTSSLSASSRPTDETFRAYFTKQLNSSKIVDEPKKVAHESNQPNSKIFNDKERSSSNLHQVTYQTNIQVPFITEDHSKNNEGYDENRICPICKVSFLRSTPQNEFEAHVIEHLEAVGTSLLEQC